MSPPVLISPTKGKQLLLYVSATSVSLGALLAKHDDEKRKEKFIISEKHLLVMN